MLKFLKINLASYRKDRFHRTLFLLYMVIFILSGIAFASLLGYVPIFQDVLSQTEYALELKSYVLEKLKQPFGEIMPQLLMPLSVTSLFIVIETVYNISRDFKSGFMKHIIRNQQSRKHYLYSKYFTLLYMVFQYLCVGVLFPVVFNYIFKFTEFGSMLRLLETLLHFAICQFTLIYLVSLISMMLKNEFATIITFMIVRSLLLQQLFDLFFNKLLNISLVNYTATNIIANMELETQMRPDFKHLLVVGLFGLAVCMFTFHWFEQEDLGGQ